MDRTGLLQTCRIFEGLDGAQIEQIARLGRSAEYPAGTSIFNEKGPAEKLYVIESGKVALQMQLPGSRGRRLTVDIARESEVFGWSALVDWRPYTLTSVCLENSQILEIDGPALRMLMEGDTAVGFYVMKGLIKLVASRLDETRHLLASERTMSGVA